jgi:hypothetical protein
VVVGLVRALLNHVDDLRVVELSKHLLSSIQEHVKKLKEKLVLAGTYKKNMLNLRVKEDLPNMDDIGDKYIYNKYKCLQN